MEGALKFMFFIRFQLEEGQIEESQEQIHDAEQIACSGIASDFYLDELRFESHAHCRIL